MRSRLSSLFSCLLFIIFYAIPVFSYSQYPNSHLNNSLLGTNNTHSTPFGFLNNIKGCQKGQKVKGIRGLKRYLSQFGYLNYNFNATNPREDRFDVELEEAIKSYQVYYHLNATGTLDEPTVSKMAMPRCGFPDKEIHRGSSNNNSLHIVSHYRFFPSIPRWPRGKRHLTYAFGSRFPTRFMTPVAQAFNRWATASRYFTFSQAQTYRGADLKITFARGDHGDRNPFDGRGGVLAHAFAPTDGRLHYDADEPWVVGAVPNAYDVETLALHEIGHLLGLGHSQYQNAIMWAEIRAGVTKGLNSDDIRGIRALYGS